LQLHQVQEELESIFLKHEAAQNDRHKIAQARDAQAQLAAERQAQIEQLSRSHAALNGEKEALAQEKLALASRRDSLEKESAALAHARDVQAQLAAERQAKIEALSAERDQHAQQAAERQTSLGHKIKEATQENELLLLQLHQVQEELEHYFLQQQNAQQQLAGAEERWQRMLQRTPDYCDYASLEILPGENSADGTGTESATCTWRLKNLNAAGRTLPQLDFDTLVEQGVVGWVIHRSPGSAGPLVRWPSAAAQQNDVTLIPLDPADRVETLRDLATRDWDLLQTLAQLLANTLEAPGDLKLPAHLQIEPLRSGLEHFSRLLAEFPATLRYDAVGLKREQVNRDYEHLWLHFDNLAFDGRRWPAFEFRLSCANVRPNLFGKYPKLEFPEESGQAPFEAWFIEAYDDFGAKLELRFALPESMDLGVWQQVSERDQNFLRALIERLPAILLALQSAGTPLKRSWNDWIDMAHEMQRITALRAALPPAPEPETPEPTAPAAPLAPEPRHAPAAEAVPAEKTVAQPSPAARATKMRKV
jgi:hypothetical protein